ncbi:uncharacterized protein RJT21DRAFT_121817 [Scheffersomyces amazonensis]|uniref:uncharacterized protein n=1 Tax=Scheffersomyces amazonensis TaxID=1078765 RepID=UPI00315C7F50
MSSIPMLTIPEGAYDPNGFTSIRRKSQLVQYLIRLTNGSSIGLILAYAIGMFVIKPLLETTATRRLQVWESYRKKLMDFYLSLITKVSYIPIVAKKKDNDKRLYNDMVIQTDDSYLDKSRYKSEKEKNEELEANDKLYQLKLHNRLKKLNVALNNIDTYSVQKLSNFKSASFAIKDFQNKTDLVYFTHSNYFTDDSDTSNSINTNTNTTKDSTNTNTTKDSDNKDSESKKNFSGVRRKNLATETKNEIRSIKGSLMTTY